MEGGSTKTQLSVQCSNTPAEQFSPKFVYSPLSKDEFRLFKLFPAFDFNAPIICQLITSNLGSPPRYEALSYVWGSAISTASIELDANPVFPIGENLDLALRYLRLPDKKRTLWVDAICINQANQNERSEQVSRMGDIFQLCEAVLVYVGPYPSQPSMFTNPAETPESIKKKKAERYELLKFGLEIMDKISDKDISTLNYLKNDERRNSAACRMWDLELWEEKDWFYLDDRQKIALEEVFTDSPIWNRVWIVQELSCARRAVLVGGDSILEWEKISSFLGDTVYADAFHAAFSHGAVRKIVSFIFSNPATFNQQRGAFRDIKTGYISTLFDVLARFRHTLATDERDKIYGLLGLVSEKHSVSPDYNKTYQQVFTEVAESIINTSANLDILCQSPWSDNMTPKASGIPSWVPDFTYSGHPIRLFAQRGVFSAGAPTCKTPCKVIEYGTLSLSGILLGRVGPFTASVDDSYDNSKVNNSTETFSNRPSNDTQGPAMLPQKWMRQYFGNRLLENTSPSYITGESALQAYWRTLLTDCTFHPIKRLTDSEILDFGKTFISVLHGDVPDEELHNEDYFPMLYRMVEHWSFTLTTNGLYLMIQSHVKEGDLIVVLHGAKIPVVLRPVKDSIDTDETVKYNLISTAYVHGYMDGEAMKGVEDGRLIQQDFSLI